MKLSKVKKICAAALTVAMSMSLFVGCGSSSSNSSSTTTAVEQKLVYNLGADPETIDPTLNTAVDGSIIIVNAFEGLVNLDENQKAIEGVAKSWTISDDGLVYTFKLREDAKWSDGKAVTAKDFVYSWKRALTKTNGSEYSYQLYYIKNAEKFYNGEAKEADLGIKVVDDYTLEVTLEAPTAYFLGLTASPVYMPLREDIVSANADTWATKPETYVTNGAFKLTKWDMKDQLVFEKNDNYWNKDSIKLTELTYKLVTDQDSAYASLEAGDFDMIDSVPPAMIEQGKADGLVKILPYLGTYAILVNVGNHNDGMPADVKAFLGDSKVRQALALAIDRTGIVTNVTKGGQVPAYAFVPTGIKDADGKDFASTQYYDANTANVDKAKELLKEAGYGDGGKAIPTIELMYNSEGSHKDIMQVVQQNWAKIGVTANLTNQEWKVFLQTRQDGGYQIARYGWIGDYNDPMTFLDMWVTGGGNNNAGYSNAEYDSIIAKAKVEGDATKREALMKQAQDILMADMPIIPIYFYTKIVGMQENVKGVNFSTLGQIYFQGAYIE